MTQYLYLSLMPEALIASMLAPEAFGRYYATGSDRKVSDHAMFIEIDPAFRNEAFQIEEGFARCAPHEDGTPKKSVYISVYRVLERIPLSAMRNLYLVTAHGEVLALEPAEVVSAQNGSAHMYQEIAPVQPLVVSNLGPQPFADVLSQDADSLVHLPAVAFVELSLGELAEKPESGSIEDLPYDNIPHLRECLLELKAKRSHSKMVHRVHGLEFPYRMIQSGIYISKIGEGKKQYPMPSRDTLRTEHSQWWRSANRI